jgi:hypothetical protein
MARRAASTAEVVDLSPTASRFLDLVVELGHLDDSLIDRVNDALLGAPAAQGQIDLPTVKRIVAAVLFDAGDSLDADQRRALDAEWAFLFS